MTPEVSTAPIEVKLDSFNIFTALPNLKAVSSDAQVVLVKGEVIGEVKRIKAYGNLTYWGFEGKLYRTPEEAGLALLVDWTEK
jgi:hypothetical protein